MALADFAPVARPSIVAAAFCSVRLWLAAQRRAHARRIVLNDLLFMPEHRLRDLGIEPRQIVGAVDERYWPTRK
jgi:uncharacterized protein YjiS (DUF1127 family)